MGSKEPKRDSIKLVRQVGHGGAHIQGIALSLASRFSGPRGSHAGARALQGGEVSEAALCPLTSSQRSSSCPAPGQEMEGVGVQAKATREACGKQGEETAVASRAAEKSSGPAISPHSSVLRGHTGPILMHL